MTPASVPKMMPMMTSVEEKLFPEGIIILIEKKIKLPKYPRIELLSTVNIIYNW